MKGNLKKTKKLLTIRSLDEYSKDNQGVQSNPEYLKSVVFHVVNKRVDIGDNAPIVDWHLFLMDPHRGVRLSLVELLIHLRPVNRVQEVSALTCVSHDLANVGRDCLLLLSACST